ncbi:MAG: PspC domain-containing protein [Bacteroidales bacterium]|nr:PspC domain-containing protein [Bacteroidales bacterium]
MNYSRFYRSRTQKVFGGVSGGIAEYFNMDPVIIRVIFVLAAIFGGGGVIIYLVLWVAVPERPFTSTFYNAGTPPEPDPTKDTPPVVEPEPGVDIANRRYTGSMIGGIILIGIGAIILVTRVVPNVYFRDLWPFILVAAGVVLILTSMNQPTPRQQ